MTDGMREGWLMREFARARERSAKVPPFARPVVIRRRDRSTDGWSHKIDRGDAFTVRCPMCRKRIQFDVFIETWIRPDEDSASRARISVPSVHTCSGG